MSYAARPLLPPYVIPEQTCCFTGHRQISESHRDSLRAVLDGAVKQLYDDGFRCFIAGGALGFDTFAAAEILRFRRFAEDIRLILVLPCHDQTARWQMMRGYPELLRQYKYLLGMADAAVYISDFYTETCMEERNRFMVEHSSVCIAYYSGRIRSGAGQTFRMAQKAGLRLCNLWDFLPSDKNNTAKN